MLRKRVQVHFFNYHKCPDCNTVNVPHGFKLQKCHFHWITRCWELQGGTEEVLGATEGVLGGAGGQCGGAGM